MAPLNGGSGCKPKPFPCGYRKDAVITQTLKAGELINVSFMNQNFPKGGRKGDEKKDQGRHSGGLCEFSLSVDDGKSFHMIANYSRGCPDIFFKFPVRIPNNIPTSDNAIFAWTWINASGNHMNCADVTLIGISSGVLSGPDITKANLPGVRGFDRTIFPYADVNSISNAKGPGPNESEINRNGGFGGNGNDVPVIIFPSDETTTPIEEETDCDKVELISTSVISSEREPKSNLNLPPTSSSNDQTSLPTITESDIRTTEIKPSDILVETTTIDLPSIVTAQTITIELPSVSTVTAELQSSPNSLPTTIPRETIISNALQAQLLEVNKKETRIGDACDLPGTTQCIATKSIGFCNNSKLEETGRNCGDGLECFHFPLESRLGIEARCSDRTEFDHVIDISLQ
ncbi:hypothetical protein HK098_003708 [Nowakowskiella sp. JEL0407]|nr:hypothetical protein HK098_003708 [Nowakowskiella sp. JEL0407]